MVSTPPRGEPASRLDYSSNSDDETCGTALLIPHWKAELERLDPMHRYAKNLRAYEPAWKEQCSTVQTLWEWLEENPTFSVPECSRETLDSQRVQYLDAEAREAYRVDVKEGRFRRNGEIFSTGEGEWIFVLSSNKTLYINRKVRGEFHHTSFLGGESCLAAGGMTVVDGRLVDQELDHIPVAGRGGEMEGAAAEERFSLALVTLGDHRLDRGEVAERGGDVEAWHVQARQRSFVRVSCCFALLLLLAVLVALRPGKERVLEHLLA